MFPRVTHPSATDVSLRPFDLHVLSLPPAFVLSQDQTLKFNVLPEGSFEIPSLDYLPDPKVEPRTSDDENICAPILGRSTDVRRRRRIPFLANDA